MADSQILRLVFSADTTGATSAISGLSKSLQASREEWKRQIYEQKSAAAAAKVGILEQVAAEKQRSLTAKIGLAEQVLGEKQRVAALKNTESATLAVARAQANLDSLRSQKSLSGAIDNQRIQQAKGRASTAQRQYELRVAEKKESPQGLSGLERLFAYAGGQNVGIATLREGANLFSNLLPQGIQQTGSIASRVLGQSGIISSGLSTTAIAATGLSVALGVGGLVGAATIAAKSIGYLTEALQKASQEEIGAIGQASEIQRIYGVDQRQADSFYRDLQIGTELAGKKTSVSGDEISRLNNIILPSILKIGKESGTALDQVDDRAVELSKRFAILAQTTPSVTPMQVTGALASATSGQLGQAIKTQEFFMNSGLKTVIEDTAKKQGVDLSKATAAQQVRVFEEAIKLRVPDSLIDRAQSAVVSQISSFTDGLFAPRTGAFGVMRDIEKDVNGKLKEGTSVYDSFAKSVKLVIGEGGTLDQISKLFRGTKFDAMEELKNAIDSLNNFLESFNRAIGSLNAGLDTATKTIQSNPLVQGYNAIQENQVARTVTNTIGGAATQATKFLPGGTFINGLLGLFGFGKPSYMGHIPDGITIPMSRNAADGYVPIWESIMQEQRQKPSGSDLIVANSSEYVFKDKAQMMQYVGLSAASGSVPMGGNVTKQYNFSPSFNVAPGMSTDALAREVMAKFDEWLEAEQSSSLA